MTGIKTRITLYKNLNNFQHADKPKKGKGKGKGERKKETLTLPDEENIAVDYEEHEDAGTEVIQKRPLDSVKEPDEIMGDAEIDEFDPKLTEADLRLPYGEVTLEEYLADANLDESMET